MDLKQKEISITFEVNLYDKLRRFLLQNQMEQMSYLFCHTSTNDTSINILPKKIIFFENDGSLLKKGSVRVWLDPDMVNEVYYRFINSDFNCLINCHSHPFERGDVFFSNVDDDSDWKESKYFNSEIRRGKLIKQRNENILHASIVLGQHAIAARTIDLERKTFIPIDKIKILSEPVKIITPTNKKKIILPVHRKIVLPGNQKITIRRFSIGKFLHSGKKDKESYRK